MTVREKMNRLMAENPDYRDCGHDYHLDGRQRGILQEMSTGGIAVVSISKDDTDNEGDPQTVIHTYDDLKGFIENHPLDSTTNPRPTRRWSQ